MTTKKTWNPTRVLKHIDQLLDENTNIRVQMLQAEQAFRDVQEALRLSGLRVLSLEDQVTYDGRAMKKVITENEELRARLRSSEATAQQNLRLAEERTAQLRAADETAGKALADAKRARDESRKSEIYVLQREVVGGGSHCMPFISREAALKHIKTAWNTEGGRYSIKEHNPNCWDVLDGQGNFMYRYQGCDAPVKAA